MVHAAAKLIYRLRESLKYRIFYGYCNTLRRIKCSNIPTIGWKPLDASLPLFVAITRDTDIPLLRYCLHSMMQQVKVRPRFWLVGDSDAAYIALQQQFAEAQPEVTILHWQTLLQSLPSKYQEFMADWTRQPKWGGFGKKFVTIAAANQEDDIVLFDADILWYGDFLNTLTKMQDAAEIIGGRDHTYAYTSVLVETLQDQALLEKEPLCSGFMYCPKGVVLNHLPTEQLSLLKPILPQADMHFEQTLMAHIFWQAGGQFFTDDVLATTLADNFQFRNRFKALVRHYAGAKHLFWRDAS